jgi:nitrous oxidase accessory protein
MQSSKKTAKTKSYAAVLVLTLVLSAAALAPLNLLNLQFAQAAKIITVPDDYPTICAAVGNASDGDTILVKAGVYRENPAVNKTVALKGEGNNQTVVVGTGGVERGANPVFTLAADGITLSGFSVTSESYPQETNFASGIKIAANNCTLTGNEVYGTYYGLFSSLLSNSVISGNTVRGALKDGIRLCGGSRNTITSNVVSGSAQSGLALDGYLDTVANNTFQGNNRGIGLGASFSVVYANNITGSRESGFYMASSNNTLAFNYVENGVYGVFFTSFFAAPNGNLFYGNDFLNVSTSVGTDSDYNLQVWDFKGQGNYWSNYTGSDSNGDGVGDTPFNLVGNNTDNYPRIQPSSLLSAQALSAPALPTPPSTINGVAVLWHFDVVEPNGVTFDAVGDNPAMLEPTSGGNGYTPVLVQGKEGNALRFNGTDYAYATGSPSLAIANEVTIDAWVNVQEYKDVAYNNIVVECLRTPDKYPTRIMGFAINGAPPENGGAALGALRGFFVDTTGVFNEVVTTESMVPLNQWVHVVFTRSVETGMHIYVGDQEQTVMVTAGLQNPNGAIAEGTEFYIGHDSICTIDETSISTIATAPQPQPTPTPTPEPEQALNSPVWQQWWLWTTIIGVCAIAGSGFFLLKRNSTKKPPA